MIYRCQPPTSALKDYVRCYWLLESESPYTHYAMADTCAELLFHYNGLFNEVKSNGSFCTSFRSGLCGPSNQIKKFEIDRGFGLFGIYLYPHTLMLLAGMPVNELSNQMPSLDELLGNLGDELEEQIMLCSNWQERIERIEAFLVERIERNAIQHLPVVSAIKHIVHDSPSPSVKSLAARYSISERQLERKFLQYTGFSPKHFMRIARFRKAVGYYGNAPLKLTEIAHYCGYYDQAHFIHDFKRFSGVRPREFFAGKTQATAWLD